MYFKFNFSRNSVPLVYRFLNFLSRTMFSAVELVFIGAGAIGHRGARAPHFWFVVGTGAQITDMKRKWSSLEDDRQFAHSIWKYEQHMYNVIFLNSS